MKIWVPYNGRARSAEIDGVWVEVDDDDYDSLIEYSWYVQLDDSNKPVSIGRAPIGVDDTHCEASLVLMNRQILGIDEPSITVRHKNKNPLDCRKGNLEVKLDGYAVRRLRRHWIGLLRIEFKLRR